MDTRAIDRLVAEKVMGWKWRRWKSGQVPDSIADAEQRIGTVFLMRLNNLSWNSSEDAQPDSGTSRTSEQHRTMRERFGFGRNVTVAWDAMLPPQYSTDIAAAWEVVEKMKADGWAVNIYSGNGSQCWEAEFGHPSDRSQDAGSETSPLPLAICLAALRVKGVEVDNA